MRSGFGLNRGLGSIMIACALLLTAASAEADDMDDREVSRAHAIEVGGRRLVYESLVGREPVRVAGTDQVRARMFYVATA